MESKKEFIQRMLNKPMFYNIDGQPVDMEAWSTLYEQRKRTMAYDDINYYRVSTVFIGVDMGIGMGGPPLLFETMIFGPEGSKLNLWQDRYPTKEQALHGHVYACRLASGEISEDD